MEADKVQHVQDAVSKGAKILVGGKRGNRTEYIPTVLTDMTDDCVRPFLASALGVADDIVDGY